MEKLNDGNDASDNRRSLCLMAAGLVLAGKLAAATVPVIDDDGGVPWSDRFASVVDYRLAVPSVDQQRYQAMLEWALIRAGLSDLPAQAFVVVDRRAQVQAAMVIVRIAAGSAQWLGATAVSTGKTGTFEHFLTPLGVFAHTLDNPDFRAEGTFNKNHIRGYGLRGRRVFDFGWQDAERGWGRGGHSQMRLQMRMPPIRYCSSPGWGAWHQRAASASPPP
jgi:hypothetical protein